MRKALEIRIRGLVQGVGFRPFVYRLATELGLFGWVINDSEGVLIRAEGESGALEEFIRRLKEEKPPPAVVEAIEIRSVAPEGYGDFRIRKSRSRPRREVGVLPDLATCPYCLQELFDRGDRRYRYPFINCTYCGPRFTIIESLPYDRQNTTMRIFPMCDECRQEYESPADRRFHAQPIACHRCGPTLLWKSGNMLLRGEEALRIAEEYIRDGKIVALKGLGGYQLVVDARNQSAVDELRRRKGRPHKPFAVMFPDEESLRMAVSLSDEDMELLRGPVAPILLAPKREGWIRVVAPSVAPASAYLGVFLPYTPLHHLLMRDLSFPIVATSANVSGELIEYRDESALRSLSPLVDGFLYHDRPIRRHADDSVMVHAGKKRIVARRARGMAPSPIYLKREIPPFLALGAHMNAAFGVSRRREIIVSQHYGDLDSPGIRNAYLDGIRDFLNLFGVDPVAVVHDMHPDYYTTHLAARLSEERGIPAIAVQHHHAHVAAVLVEHGVEGKALAMVWDGTGYGLDGTVWGGEFLYGDTRDFERVATLMPFHLPGGERAIKEPWRIALALLMEAFEGQIPEFLYGRLVSPGDASLLARMMERGINSPLTTSMGRLFDGVGALLGLARISTYQAELPQRLEQAAFSSDSIAPLPDLIPVERDGIFYLNWKPLVRQIVHHLERGAEAGNLAAGFVDSIARSAANTIRLVGESRVLASGGVFLNGFLHRRLDYHLSRIGVKLLLPEKLPPTDGGIAAGQIWIAASRISN